MEYLSEQEVVMAFYNLIGIQSEIYDLTVKKLLELEKEGIKDPSKYDKIIKQISRLKTKEKRIYEKLDTSEYYYELIDIVENIINEISNGDEEKQEALEERIDFYFSNLFNEECMFLELNENIYDYIDIDEEDYEGEIVLVPEFKTIDFYTPVQIKFIRNLMEIDSKNEEYLKYKFYNSFTHPRLEEELFIARYNPDNIHDIDTELEAKASDIELEEYKENMKLARASFTENAFTNFVERSITPEITSSELDLPFQEVLFGASTMETKTLADFVKRHFGEEETFVVSENAVETFEKLGNNLLDIIFEREDYDETVLNIINSDNVNLDFSEIKFEKETYENLFNMVNTSKEIYFLMTDLYCLDLIGKKTSKEYLDKIGILEELTKKEKEYAMELNFATEEKEAAKELIEKYLEFIYTLDGRGGIIDSNIISRSIIEKRIGNILWNTLVPDLSTFKDESVPYTIIKNYQLECLNEYEKIINGEDKEELLAFKYLEIVSDYNLTEEFIFEKGNIENAIILDDEITSKILGIELDEYQYDKDDLIANHSYDIMTSLAMFPEDYELEGFDKAALEYQSIALEIAFKYVNEEDLETLKSNFESSEMIKNSILSKKLKSIFNKKEKKIELTKKRH